MTRYVLAALVAANLVAGYVWWRERVALRRVTDELKVPRVHVLRHAPPDGGFCASEDAAAGYCRLDTAVRREVD